MKITNNCVVEVAYRMNFVDDDDYIESFSERNPLEFLMGMGEMLDEFEAKLMGKAVGENLDFVITKDKAFGEFDDSLVKDVPIETFYDDQGIFNSDIIKEGALITLNTEDKGEQDAYVIEVTDKEVLVDMNHPYAGEDLHYDLMILSVRILE